MLRRFRHFGVFGPATLAVMGVLAIAGVHSAAASQAAPQADSASLLRQTRSVLLGVSSPGDDAPADGLAHFARVSGKAAGLANVYASFASPGFPERVANSIRARGAVPMVTWLPCLDGSLGARQPKFALSRILAADYDAYIRRWATGAAEWSHPLLLRFAPEMNGPWNPWSAGVNGNRARDYVQAWRHVHGLFDKAGAVNVRWVWSPNVVAAGTVPLRSLYPGDAYVDWVGIDGYNWGTTRPGSRWQSFGQVFGRTLSQVRRLTHKPLMLSEVGSSEAGGDKSAWIRGMFRALRRNPTILAFVWFNFNKETDWRIESSAGSRRAFAAGVAAPRVQGAWSAPETA